MQVLYNLQVLYSPLFWHTAEKLEPEKVYLHIGMRLQSSPSLPPVTKLSHIEVRKTWQVATVLGKYTPVVEIPTVAEVCMYISSPCSTCVCNEGLVL